MKIKIISIINIFFGILIFSLPIFVSAQIEPIISHTEGVDYYTFDIFWQTLLKVIDAALQLATILVVVIIVWAGALYLTSNGNSGKISQANNMLKNAVIGLFIALAAWLIVNVITKTLEVNGGDGGFLPGGFNN